jgi:two-component system, sensor histidine kinase and response regulator
MVNPCNTQQSTVLVVDDHSKNIQILGKILQDQGYSLAFALSGKEALAIVENNIPDLILLDLLMPEMDGLKVCEILKSNEKFEEIPIIFLTASHEQKHLIEAFEKGAADYVTKPFQKMELLARVKHHLRLKHQTITLKIRETELSQALAREKEISNFKNRIISVASHEFRSPMTVILGFAQLLLKHYQSFPPEKVNQYLSNIEASAKKITNMIDDLLTLSHIDSGQIKVNAVGFDLLNFCERFILEIKDGIAHNHQLDFKVSPKINNLDRQFILDKKLLEYTLYSLISNAVKFSAVNTVITFEVSYDDNWLTFLIKDQGIGIPFDEQKHLFDLFYRASNAKDIQGTGLGLNIIHRYVELQGGTIEVESQENIGTTFIVYLPKNIEL